MGKDWTKETIPNAVVNKAIEWGKNFVTKTNWMTAHETMGEFNFGNKDVFLQAKNADEHDISMVWKEYSIYQYKVSAL